ncbi:glycoside hydrolase family 3 protein [Cuneatibacter caecimuris]|uniref:beta-N-acetylhexosaminidase n=1 Tax=Cuneatibacter caecimuris TaxID=1796618 RepID=A0A4Q7P3E9_9FIRM|nr:glycoside hydrolase family 3 N-terminal domain-containing protein [Cuneatibacter caecimuris]RZS94456.1 gluconate kinase (SKI family) [Cuneatibacter caecimuris]
MVDLKGKPFYLSDADIKWVEDTIASMTMEEKIGQLFVLMAKSDDENDIKEVVEKYHQAGLRYPPKTARMVWEQNRNYQKYSRIPMLMASNCDNGGDGACSDGTYIATAAACGAAPTRQTSFDMGYVSGKESEAIGSSWVFNPCCDIFMNWRNTIINTRSFGNETEAVIENIRAFIDGVHQSNVACCCKHFPGDGVEDRDQHLVLGVNDLSAEDWDNSYRRVYQAMIDEDLETIMVGHIALPEMSRRLRPGIQDQDIMPATLAPELLTDLLRGEMGFNGLIITDASHMGGIANMMKREYAVPLTIAAGCDLFLYANDYDEDFGYMRKGIENGVITPERLEDALKRILGLKAHLHLHERQAAGTLVPEEDALKTVGCPEHLELAKKAADQCITLVKDTQKNLPIRPDTHKRIRLFYIGSTPVSRAYKGDPVKQVVIEELQRAGFEVSVAPSMADLEVEYGVRPENNTLMTNCGSRKDFQDNYDAVMMFINVKGYAQENNVRIRWSVGHSNEMPWFVTEKPTVGVSLNYTTHLWDVPQIHTFINSYGHTREVIRQTIEKIMGGSEFKGTANDTVFCGKWDTRL